MGILEFVILVLLAMWLLGLATSTTLNGFLHILIVIAVIVFIVRLLQGRTAV